MPTAGKTLKVERVRANITATALAAQMGLSRQSLWVLERSASLTAEQTVRYRTALAQLRDGIEPSEAVA